jgi:hypothetical protein
MWGVLSDQRTGLSINADGRRQHSHSRLWIARDSWSYFTASDMSLICHSPIWFPEIFVTVSANFFKWGVLSDQRTGLSINADGRRQHSHSRLWIERGSWSYLTASDMSLILPERSGYRIYNLQEQCGPIITQDTGSHFCCPLLLAGLRQSNSDDLLFLHWSGTSLRVQITNMF